MAPRQLKCLRYQFAVAKAQALMETPQETPCSAPPALSSSASPDASLESLNAPEWIDVSPDAPPDAPAEAREDVALAAPDSSFEPADSARWILHWSSARWIVAILAAIFVTHWLTWRQSVNYQPPLELSALATAAPASTSAPAATSAPTATPTPQRILVHVIGLVKKPGVFEMREGARLKDALHWAGGPLPNADLEAINLAEKLEDGRQYQVPARQKQGAAPTERQNRAQVLAAPHPNSERSTSHDSGSDSSTKSQAKPRSASQRSASQKAPSAPIDLNRASVEELQQLPGVGPATAQKIAEYRAEIGGFKSVDDLDGVKGIGPKKLDKIRPFALVR